MIPKLILKATHEESKISPESIYAVTKYNQEQVAMLMGKVLNIPVISLRYQNVYGPGQSLSDRILVYYQFFNKIIK